MKTIMLAASLMTMMVAFAAVPVVADTGAKAADRAAKDEAVLLAPCSKEFGSMSVGKGFIPGKGSYG